MKEKQILDCLVCHQPLNNPENPDKCLCCGFELLPGLVEDVHELRELQKPRAAAYRSKAFLSRFDVGITSYYWKDENGSIVLDTAKRLSFGSGADLENKTVWLDQEFARLSDGEEPIVELSIRREGGSERIVECRLPCLTEPQLQKLGLRLNEKLELQLELKNESGSVFSAPVSLLG